MGQYAVAGMQPPPGCWRTLQINQTDRIAQVIEKGDVSLKPTRMARFPALSDEKKAGLNRALLLWLGWPSQRPQAHSHFCYRLQGSRRVHYGPLLEAGGKVFLQ